MLTKKTVAVYLAAVFAAGLMAGAAAGFSWGERRAFKPPRPKEMASHMCAHLRARLGLSSEQVEQIQPILTQTAAELDAIHSASAKQIADLFQKSNRRVAQFLTPEQRKLLEQMDRERQQFLRKGAHPPPPGPRGGHPPPVESGPHHEQ